MNLNYNSVIARMYRYFWANEDNMPDNLCPFFWKLVIALIWFVPLLILSLPLIILEAVFQDNDRDIKHPFGRMGAGLFIGLILFLLFMFLVAQYELIRYFLNCYSYDNDAATIAGILNIMILFFYIKNKLKNKNDEIELPEILQITKEFISATYHRYCPQIKWKK